MAPLPFTAKVGRVVRAIPRGSYLSYGEVALRAGKPGAARAVVQALHRLDDIPWWRVVRANGTLAPCVRGDQEQLLRCEGVTLRGDKLVAAARGRAFRPSTEARGRRAR